MKPGRPVKKPEDRKVFKTRSISGSPAEIAELELLAKKANKSVSRYVLDNLLKK